MEQLTVRQGNTVTVTSSAEMFAPTNTGGKIRLLRCILSASADGVYQLQDGSGGTTVAAGYIEAKKTVEWVLTPPPGAVGSEFGAVGKALTAATSLYAVGPSGGVLNITAVCVESGF